MVALKIEWRIKEEVCGWVGFHHFLLLMIFWWLGNLNYYYKKRRKLWNIMEVNWFFFIGFFLYYSFSFSIDDDFVTFFKESAIGKRTILFATWIPGISLLSFVAIILIIEHLSYYCYCCNCFGNKLRKKYVVKMSITKMSYFCACS